MRQIADKVGAVYIFDMAHIAGLVAGGVHPSPCLMRTSPPPPPTRPSAGPLGLILCGKDLAAAVDKAVFPGQQGGPLVHIVAAKAVAFGEALRPEFQNLRRADRGQCQGAGHLSRRSRLPHYLRRHGQPLDAGDVFQKGILGSEAELALGKAASRSTRTPSPTTPIRH